jgi:hypothetical protein
VADAERLSVDLAMPKSGRVAAALGSMALASYGAMHVASRSSLVSLIYATVVGGLVYALFTLDVAEIRGNAAAWLLRRRNACR